MRTILKHGRRTVLVHAGELDQVEEIAAVLFPMRAITAFR
jgi:hypothetical protein